MSILKAVKCAQESVNVGTTRGHGNCQRTQDKERHWDNYTRKEHNENIVKDTGLEITIQS